MAGFNINVHRLDPYKNFKFRVVWDGKVIHGIERISGLRRETEVVEHRSGSDPNQMRRSPGISQYNPIVLERGRTHDHAFEAWANLVFDLAAASGESISLKTFRKDIEISLLNEAGQVVMGFNVYRCWPSIYEPLANLDAHGREVVRERLVLQHEGWERDLSVQEPVEQ